ncbi:MAG TPA: sensor histidine kinase [Nocardioides sp.]|uniref:sensor histidine kinase n=1 Tax=Nocardioides sp. TaxID=35761 RepID=UPI002F405AB0
MASEGDHLRNLLHDLKQYVATGMLLCDDEDALLEEELRSRLKTGRMLFKQLSAIVDVEAEAAGSTPVDIGELVDESVSIFRHGHPTLHVRVAHEDGLVCQLERESMHRALSNLLENAARAAGKGGHVTVQAWAENGYVLIEVSDDGRGFGQIPRGSGRGMQTVSDLVRSARGRLEIHSGPDAGTRVRLVLVRGVEGAPR